jgi:hypothetical protein
VKIAMRGLALDYRASDHPRPFRVAKKTVHDGGLGTGFAVPASCDASEKDYATALRVFVDRIW